MTNNVALTEFLSMLKAVIEALRLACMYVASIRSSMTKVLPLSILKSGVRPRCLSSHDPNRRGIILVLGPLVRAYRHTAFPRPGAYRISAYSKHISFRVLYRSPHALCHDYETALYILQFQLLARGSTPRNPNTALHQKTFPSSPPARSSMTPSPDFRQLSHPHKPVPVADSLTHSGPPPGTQRLARDWPPRNGDT